MEVYFTGAGFQILARFIKYGRRTIRIDVEEDRPALLRYKGGIA